MLDHVVEHWRHSLLREVGISQADNCIEVLSEYSILALHVSEFLPLDQKLTSRLADVAAADPEVVQVEVTGETPAAKANVGALSRLLHGTTEVIIVREMHVLRVDFFVQNPGVAAASVE